jgi:hypothetical protein
MQCEKTLKGRRWPEKCTKQPYKVIKPTHIKQKK